LTHTVGYSGPMYCCKFYGLDVLPARNSFMHIAPPNAVAAYKFVTSYHRYLQGPLVRDVYIYARNIISDTEWLWLCSLALIFQARRNTSCLGTTDWTHSGADTYDPTHFYHPPDTTERLLLISNLPA